MEVLVVVGLLIALIVYSYIKSIKRYNAVVERTKIASPLPHDKTVEIIKRVVTETKGWSSLNLVNSSTSGDISTTSYTTTYQPLFNREVAPSLLVRIDDHKGMVTIEMYPDSYVTDTYRSSKVPSVKTKLIPYGHRLLRLKDSIRTAIQQSA